VHQLLNIWSERLIATYIHVKLPYCVNKQLLKYSYYSMQSLICCSALLDIIVKSCTGCAILQKTTLASTTSGWISKELPLGHVKFEGMVCSELDNSPELIITAQLGHLLGKFNK